MAHPPVSRGHTPVTPLPGLTGERRPRCDEFLELPQPIGEIEETPLAGAEVADRQPSRMAVEGPTPPRLIRTRNSSTPSRCHEVREHVARRYARFRLTGLRQNAPEACLLWVRSIGRAGRRYR